MATAKLNWANKDGEVYELIVDEVGNPINFKFTKDSVVLNDPNQKPIKTIDPKILKDEMEIAIAETANPTPEPTAQVAEEPKPKKRGRPKKQP